MAFRTLDGFDTGEIGHPRDPGPSQAGATPVCHQRMTVMQYVLFFPNGPPQRSRRSNWFAFPKSSAVSPG
jgi:hypothetical protein